MELSHADRRLKTDRRASTDRRGVVTVAVEERRAGAERRAQPERRTPESAGEHIRNALQLLTNVAESGTLDDESLRDLDAAMFRLRFALDRLEARGQ
jgi:hypothetical protein